MSRRILLVEDNEDDERIALRALAKSKILCDVEVARDGIEAVDSLFSHEKPSPRVVLLDLKLPRLNGLEVLSRIRGDEHTRRLPVVVLTSSAEPSDVFGCFDRGANSYVRKVVDYDSYVQRLSAVAEYWLNLNEPCR